MTKKKSDWVHIKDGKSEVRIGRSGLHITDGGDEVKIGASGIHVNDSDGSSVNINFGFGRNGADEQHPDRKPGGPYLSHSRILFGVCGGIGRHLGISPFAARLITVLFALPSGIFPCLVIYILLGLILQPEPVIDFTSESDVEFFSSIAQDRKLAAHRLRRLQESLDRRIQRMESVVTSREYEWDRRISEA